MSRNSPGLKGFATFFWAGRAGTFFFVILIRPGMVNTPAPLLLMFFLISLARASRTAMTSFLDNSVAVARLFKTSLLLGAFFAAVAAAFAIINSPSVRV